MLPLARKNTLLPGAYSQIPDGYGHYLSQLLLFMRTSNQNLAGKLLIWFSTEIGSCSLSFYSTKLLRSGFSMHI